MRSKAIWDAEDCALLLIDYQPEVIEHVHERDVQLMELNVIALAKMAVKLKIPVVLSTVAVKMGVESPTISALKEALPGVEEIDRTSMNAWEDEAFVNAVKATGRKKMVMAALVTSVCLVYPAVDALSDGYEVMFVEDAVGDRSQQEHDLAVMRLVQAGAIPNSAIAMISEWYRDWADPRADLAREFLPGYLVEAYTRRGFPLPLWARKDAVKQTPMATSI